MELYIEKEFLDNFYLEFDERNSTESQKIVAAILSEYAEVEWLIDTKINSFEELEQHKLENPFFAARCSILPPKTVDSIKDHFFLQSKCKQTLIFSQEKHDWFTDAEDKGALCFSWADYQERIASIIKNCHIKIDLSEKFPGWQVLSELQTIPLNKIIINDSYILSDKDRQKMDFNIFPLLKNLIGNSNKKVVDVEIYTDNMNPLAPGSFLQIKEAADKRFRRFNSVFANYKTSFKIISNRLQKGKYDFHDRLIYLNFLIIDSPKGFNLEPHTNSNSQLSVVTVFDKYNYNRMRRHLQMHEDYFKKIEKLETLEFKYKL